MPRLVGVALVLKGLQQIRCDRGAHRSTHTIAIVAHHVRVGAKQRRNILTETFGDHLALCAIDATTYAMAVEVWAVAGARGDPPDPFGHITSRSRPPAPAHMSCS